jgi:hypothetical protein
VENVGIFYDHLEYFMANRYNLGPFSIVCGHLVHFSNFGMFGLRKIWQHCFRVLVCCVDKFISFVLLKLEISELHNFRSRKLAFLAGYLFQEIIYQKIFDDAVLRASQGVTSF